ncbi:hypothetical protein B0H13DRAFT_1637792 [Mycena leptocephala]|nr:hypothetical protein B0H13DRAFT_1637792 [Mycena leptocephala]
MRVIFSTNNVWYYCNQLELQFRWRLGHMSWPQTAAFYPIFWLHHANVNRLFSLWSAVNPGVWVTAGSEVEGTAEGCDAESQLWYVSYSYSWCIRTESLFPDLTPF